MEELGHEAGVEDVVAPPPDELRQEDLITRIHLGAQARSHPGFDVPVKGLRVGCVQALRVVVGGLLRAQLVDFVVRQRPCLRVEVAPLVRMILQESLDLLQGGGESGGWVGGDGGGWQRQPWRMVDQCSPGRPASRGPGFEDTVGDSEGTGTDRDALHTWHEKRHRPRGSTETAGGPRSAIDRSPRTRGPRDSTEDARDFGSESAGEGRGDEEGVEAVDAVTLFAAARPSPRSR